MPFDLKIRVMKTVSEGTKEIIIKRVKNEEMRHLFEQHSALAMIHGDVCDMIYASDIAQKASGVEVFEIPGSCPQHMTVLGILGAASAVDEAIAKIKSEM